MHRDKVKGVLGCFDRVLVLRQWMVQNGEPMRKGGVSQQSIAVEYGCGRMQWGANAPSGAGLKDVGLAMEHYGARCANPCAVVRRRAHRSSGVRSLGLMITRTAGRPRFAIRASL